MKKREMIERALGSIFQIFGDPENQPPQWDNIYDAFADQIVGEPIRGSIRHGSISYTKKPLDTTVLQTVEGSLRIAREHLGTNAEEVVVMVFKKP